MNTPVLLATLGQRPQAISMALDVLLPRHQYSRVEILHTDVEAADGIGAAYEQLMPVLRGDYVRGDHVRGDYGRVEIVARCLCDSNNVPLTDITDLWSAETYFRAIVQIVRDYRIANTPIHLLVAGGRKAMSVYATLAAALLFGEQDCVWTILTSPSLMKTGHFHIPAGRHDEVELVNLPVKPSRLLPGVIAEIPLEQLVSLPLQPPRTQFIEGLTAQERVLVERLRQHPYASVRELAEYLNKAPKTIEHQFTSIYSQLTEYYDLSGVTASRKREVLLDVIHGRV